MGRPPVESLRVVQQVERQVRRASACERVAADWGELTWFANAAQGNATGLTVGRCVIRPGKANPRHSHPNCEEVLVVLQGQVRHSLGDEQTVDLDPGDVITIPPRVPHRAENVGREDAVLLVCFSSARRQVQGE